MQNDTTNITVKNFKAQIWADFGAIAKQNRKTINEFLEDALKDYISKKTDVRQMTTEELKIAVNTGSRSAQIESSYRGHRTVFYYFTKFMDSLSLEDLKTIRNAMPSLKDDNYVYCDVEILKAYTLYRIAVLTKEKQEIIDECLDDYAVWRDKANSFLDVNSEIIISLARELLNKDLI